MADTPPMGYVTLREYLDMRFRDTEIAVSKAEAATEARFNGVNEFRAQLADQTRTLIPRLEAEQKFQTLEERLGAIEARMNARDNRGIGKAEMWALIVGSVGIFGALAVITSRWH